MSVFDTPWLPMPEQQQFPPQGGGHESAGHGGSGEYGGGDQGDGGEPAAEPADRQDRAREAREDETGSIYGGGDNDRGLLGTLGIALGFITNPLGTMLGLGFDAARKGKGGPHGGSGPEGGDPPEKKKEDEPEDPDAPKPPDPRTHEEIEKALLDDIESLPGADYRLDPVEAAAARHELSEWLPSTPDGGFEGPDWAVLLAQTQGPPEIEPVTMPWPDTDMMREEIFKQISENVLGEDA